MKKILSIVLILALLFALFPFQYSLSEEITPPEGFMFSKDYQRIPVMLNSITYYAYQIEKTENNTHTVGWLIVDSSNKIVSDKSKYEKLALAATVTKYIKENPNVTTIMEADLKMLNELRWKMALNEVAQSVIKTVSSYFGTMTGNVPMGAFEEAVGMASFVPQALAIELSDNYLNDFTHWVADTFSDTLLKTGEIEGILDTGPNFLKFCGVFESIIKKGALISAKKGIYDYNVAYNILKKHTGPWSYEDAQKFLEGYTKGKAQAVAYGSWYLRLIHGDMNFFAALGLNVWDNVVKQVLPAKIKDIKDVIDASAKFVPLYAKIIKQAPDKFFYNQVEKDIEDMTMLLGILRLYYNTSIADSPATRTYNAIVASLTGTLSITSTPSGAKVYINGNYKGLTPITIKLNAGNYSIKATKDGYRDYSLTTKIEIGKTNQVNISLSKMPINTKPIWAMFHYNSQHTGRCPYDTSNNNGTLKWRYQTGSWVHSSPAIASDGTIYVGPDLYAINPDGTLKWCYQAGGGITSSPAIASDGTIYVAIEGLYAINPDGTLKWRYKIGDAYIRSSPAIASDGTIYVGSVELWDYCLYAINPDGTLKWRYQTGDNIRSSPAIASDGTIYVGSDDGYLYAINPDGRLKWRYQTGNVIDSSPAIASDGTIYVGSDDGYLYAINPDGRLKWRYETGDRIHSSPAIASDGTIYVGSDDHYLYAINPDGRLKWRYQTGGGVSSSPAIASDGTIYVGSGDHCLYAINPDGTLKWRYQTGWGVSSSPAIASDGTIYVGSDDYFLYAIGGK